ncbi:MAG: methyltransferase domain-containing protein [Hyphomicrobium aestuarii]|nr:methyltransferase domain-containing protein [Hyphomicrobium aestuarii]
MSDSEWVEAAYRVLLAREPADEEIARLTATAATPEQLLGKLVSDPLSQQALAWSGYRQLVHRCLVAKRQYVDIGVTPEQLSHLFERVRLQWSELGETDPYWSVLTNDKYRKAHVDQHLAEFEASGKHSITFFDLALDRSSLNAPQGTCLELGCGVGRVTRFLANRFENVIAVDISAGNLAICEDYLKRMDISNVELRLINSPADLEQLPDYDVLFSVIVLQHNPPPVIRYMLDQLLARVRAGGAAYFQVPTHSPGYTFSLDDFLTQPAAILDMHVLPMKHVFTALNQAGMEMQEVMSDTFTGMPGSSTFLATKPKSD